MALTRKFLASKGIEEAVIEEIITAHTETVNALKEQRDGYKEDADKLSTVQDSLDILKRKYDTKVQELDNYKKGVEAKELKRSKSTAYKQVLKELNASHVDSILKASQSELDKIELDEDGKIKDVDKLKESIKKEWADFIVEEGRQGAKTATPPASEGSKLSKEDIMKIKDPTARQKAMYENSELFGIK
jgi:hypothetical protein